MYFYMAVDHVSNEVGVAENLKMHLASLDLRIKGLQGMLAGVQKGTRKHDVIKSTLKSLQTERDQAEQEYVEVGGKIVPVESPQAVEPEMTLAQKRQAEEDAKQDHEMMRAAIKKQMTSSAEAKVLMDAVRNDILSGKFDQSTEA